MTEKNEPTVVVEPEVMAEGEAAEKAEAAAAAEGTEPEVTAAEANAEQAAEVAEAVAEEEEDETELDMDDETEPEIAPLSSGRPEPDDGDPVGPDERKWPQRLALAGALLLVLFLLVLVAFGTAELVSGDAVNHGVTNQISKAPPTKTPQRHTPAPTKTPARAITPTPAPVTPAPSPVTPATPENVNGVVDLPLQGINVDATGCRTRAQLLEQGSKTILRMTYDCPPAAIDLVTGSE